MAVLEADARTMSRCRHEEVQVEVVHGFAWVLLDATGDELDEGVTEVQPTFVAICVECRRKWEGGRVALGSAPRWAHGPVARAWNGWLKHEQERPRYQGRPTRVGA